MRKPSGPLARLLLKSLRCLSLYEDMFAISRDIEAEYDVIRANRGRIPAHLWLLGTAGTAVSTYLIFSAHWRISMFRNYVKIAFRNVRRHKTFSFINILGLAVGITACLWMLIFVISEISFDAFHTHKDRIFRVTAEWGEEGNRTRFAASMPGIAPVLGREIPEVEYAARIKSAFNPIVSSDREQGLREADAYYADPEIFSILTWNLRQGDRETALTEPFSLVISEETAIKYFGRYDPVGETLTINDKLHQIRGIMQDLPDNTHLKAEILISYATLAALGEYPDAPWNVWGDDYTYVLIKKNAPHIALGLKLNRLVEQNSPAWFAGRMLLSLQPLADIHWDIRSRGDVGPKGNRLYVILFLSASILVLLIACFNFMNLSSSQYMERMKEVGIRKVVGAKRRQLVQQFLVESVLIAVIASAMGTYLFMLLYKNLYALLNLQVILGPDHFVAMIGIVLGLVVAVGILAGSYPAFFLSGLPSVLAIKRGIPGIKGKSPLRRILVVVQYAIAIILILGTVVIYQQIDFMKNSDLGFQKEGVVLVRLPYGNQEVQQKYPLLRDQIARHPQVIGVSGVYTIPGIDSRFNMNIRRPGGGEDDRVSLQVLPGDFGYVTTMGLELKAGRDFSRDFSLDDEESILLNETAVRSLRLDNPVGSKIVIAGNREMTVIGVVKDFHVKSLHSEIGPMMITVDPKMYGTMAIRINPDAGQDILVFLAKTWEEILPFAEFNSRLMEDAYDSFYRTEDNTGRLITIFTCLALFVSALGLFGLASFMTSKRIKEIGVRKVLGASAGAIMFMLSKQFSLWVILSNIVAWPIAYFLLHGWLENFAYRIELGLLPFILSGGAAWLVAVLTVSVKTGKAALSDPVRSLRYE